MNKQRVAEELVKVARDLMADDAPSSDALEVLLKELKRGNAVLTAQKIHDDIPTIHEVGKPKYWSTVKHLGMGMFRGETGNGTFDFDGGGAMNRAGNLSWTRLNAERDVLRDLKYNTGKVKKALMELLAAQNSREAGSGRWAKEKRIDVLRRIIKEHQYEKIDGKVVDATTANMLVQVYEALRPDLQRKFDKIPLMKLVDFGWSVVK